MYLKKVKENLESQILNKGVKSFDKLFKFSKGASPDVVYPLISGNPIFHGLSTNYYGLISVNNVIPESNPTNFDWRFTDQTIKKIVAMVRNKKFKSIALFGAPSLFVPISKIVNTVVLYDINELLKVHFNQDSRVIIVDLNSHNLTKNRNFDCIIMDPPWYLNYYKLWIQKGNSILKLGGEMYITMFQELLRPKASKELQTIKKVVSLMGDFEIYENYINYITPQFEVELFNYKNIPCFSNWRVADLITIKKEHNRNISSIGNYKKDDWTRIEMGTQTIAIRNDNDASKWITVSYPYGTNDSLIKSLSIRDGIRKKLNFVTSRNRGLVITGGMKVVKLLRSISKGVPKKDLYKMEKLRKYEIIEFEKIIDTIFI
jgi:hypothetical protein